MVPEADRIEASLVEPTLGADFFERLETSLQEADQHRWRRNALRRAKALLPLLMLVGPLLVSALISASPGGVHVAVRAVAWTAFVLDVGVHLDTALLSFLGLQALPTVVGALLLVLVTGWLVTMPRGRL